MPLHDIEPDVKTNCLEAGKTQTELADGVCASPPA